MALGAWSAWSAVYSKSAILFGPIATNERMTDITLLRGGVLLLAEGAITSFVPNPDHIHVTGVADDRQEVVSLHLYGREMSGFNVYNMAAGTRRFIDLPPQRS